MVADGHPANSGLPWAYLLKLRALGPRVCRSGSALGCIELGSPARARPVLRGRALAAEVELGKVVGKHSALINEPVAPMLPMERPTRL